MLQRTQPGLQLEHLVLLIAAAGIKLKESRHGKFIIRPDFGRDSQSVIEGSQHRENKRVL